MSQIEIEIKTAVDKALSDLDKAEASISGLKTAGKSAAGGLSDTEKAIAGTRTTLLSLDKDIRIGTKNIGSMADAMHGLGINLPTTPMAALGEGIAAVVNFARQAITQSVTYNKSILDFAQAIGVSTEEASRLIQISDDVGISQGEVETALKMMTKNGLAPSLESLANLADRLNGISDPTERAAIASQLLGRNWATLNPLLAKGGAAIRAAAADVAEGLIVTQDSVAATENYRLAVDALTDSWTAFKMRVGNAVIPELTKILNDLNEADKWFQRQKRGELSGSLGVPGGMTPAAQQALKDQYAAQVAINGQLKRGADLTAAYKVAFPEAFGIAAGAAGTLEDAVGDATTQMSGAELQAQKVKTAIASWNDVNFTFGDDALKQIKIIDFKKAGGEAGENLTAEIEKALATGKITQDEGKKLLEGVYIGAEGLKAKMGEITADQAAANIQSTLGGSLTTIRSQLDAIIADYDGYWMRMYVELVTAENKNSTTWKGKGIQGRSGDQSEGAAPIGGATGLSFVVPPGYPGDTYRLSNVFASSGETVSITPPGQVTKGATSGNAETNALLRQMLSALQGLPGLISRSTRDAMLQVSR